MGTRGLLQFQESQGPIITSKSRQKKGLAERDIGKDRDGPTTFLLNLITGNHGSHPPLNHGQGEGGLYFGYLRLVRKCPLRDAELCQRKGEVLLAGESGRKERGKEKARSVLIKPYTICPRALVFAYVYSQSEEF